MAALLATSGCAPRSEPASPVTVQEPPETQTIPRCEELDEACEATAETELEVPSALLFTPPEGWHFARQGTHVVARSPRGDAVVAFAAASGNLASREDRAKIAQRIALLLEAIEVSNVETSYLEGRLQEPDGVVEEEDSFPIALWEVGDEEEGKGPRLRDTVEGTVLLVASSAPTGVLLIGAAFVTPQSAEREAPRVMAAVKSLRLATRPEAPVEDTPQGPP